MRSVVFLLFALADVVVALAAEVVVSAALLRDFRFIADEGGGGRSLALVYLMGLVVVVTFDGGALGDAASVSAGGAENESCDAVAVVDAWTLGMGGPYFRTTA